MEHQIKLVNVRKIGLEKSIDLVQTYRKRLENMGMSQIDSGILITNILNTGIILKENFNNSTSLWSRLSHCCGSFFAHAYFSMSIMQG